MSTPGANGEESPPAVRTTLPYPLVFEQCPLATGLGLSTVLGNVEQSGGSITVDSQPGSGTRFTIRLPRAQLEGSALDRPTQSRPRRRKQRATILLVEDEAP